MGLEPTTSVLILLKVGGPHDTISPPDRFVLSMESRVDCDDLAARHADGEEASSCDRTPQGLHVWIHVEGFPGGKTCVSPVLS